ncbi:MAG: tRNA dihydrouridine(20/20a) synthase DusA [Rhodospirillales bacterium]
MTTVRPPRPLPGRPAPDRRLCVAPMMDWTDRHCRVLMRLIAPTVLLYTEMVPTGAILRGDRARFLGYDPVEHPVALQLGGSDPAALAECAAIATEWGYDEVNLNCGCPSDRVTTGRFGACLMAEPETVARGVAAMRAATALPVTVKTRIGIDDRDSWEELVHFIAAVADAGCDTFIMHARKAWLSGLSPKENREIPPLRHDVVWRLKETFPDLTIVINGGIADVDAARAHLARVDGVMVGREAYQNPGCLAALAAALQDGPSPAPREAVVADYIPYVERQLAAGVPLKRMTRHMLGLYQAVPGARAFRRHLSEAALRPGAGIEVVHQAMAFVRPRPPAEAAAREPAAVPA